MNEQLLQGLSTYFNLMEMHGSLQVYRIALQQGIFRCLEQGPLSAQDMAQQLDLHLPTLQKVLTTLCQMNLLAHVQEGYQLTPVAALLAGNYQQLGAQYWDHLPQLLKSGQPLIQMDDPSQSAQHYVTQVQSLYWMMQPAAHQFVAFLQQRGLAQGRVLDIGAGSGVWSLTLAEQVGDAVQVTCNDWPPVLDITRSIAAQKQLQSVVSYIAGNYHQLNFAEQSYDLIILGNIIHLETPDALLGLLRKLKGCLTAQGHLVIIDVIDDTQGNPLAKALYNLGLALRTEHGRIYSPSELESLLQQAGFDCTQYQALSVPPQAMSVVLVQ